MGAFTVLMNAINEVRNARQLYDLRGYGTTDLLVDADFAADPGTAQATAQDWTNALAAVELIWPSAFAQLPLVAKVIP